MTEYDLIIIGSGPAGLGAAISARERGLRRVLVLERSERAGGILPQCLHSGFGLSRFGAELDGAEYCRLLLRLFEESGAELVTGAAVIAVSPDLTVRAAAGERGLLELRSGAVVLASGCRERAIGSLPVFGTRPSGVFTAGAAQRLVNLGGYKIGTRAVILGSGDVGVIMAKTLADKGCEVVCAVELSDRCGALPRNRERYLRDIPLLLRHTVTRLYGNNRLTGVDICPVDRNGEPEREKARFTACDTLLVSVGLIPETELAYDAGAAMSGGCLLTNGAHLTSVPGLFVCGNAGYIHTLADDAFDEGVLTGKNAAEYVLTGRCEGLDTPLAPPPVPDRGGAGVFTCGGCSKGCRMELISGEVRGSGCPRGREFAIMGGFLEDDD